MKTYSFLNMIVLIQGQEITEWDEGDDVINIERRVDSAVDVVGADGSMTVALSADRSGVMSFRLKQTSDSNLFLSGLLNAQENDVFTPIFCQCKDTVGNDLASGTQGYIRKFPTLTRGAAPNSQLWEIVVERLDLLLGGA